jgi:hypothetical protein
MVHTGASGAVLAGQAPSRQMRVGTPTRSLLLAILRLVRLLRRRISTRAPSRAPQRPRRQHQAKVALHGVGLACRNASRCAFIMSAAPSDDAPAFLPSTFLIRDMMHHDLSRQAVRHRLCEAVLCSSMHTHYHVSARSLSCVQEKAEVAKQVGEGPPQRWGQLPNGANGMFQAGHVTYIPQQWYALPSKRNAAAMLVICAYRLSL